MTDLEALVVAAYFFADEYPFQVQLRNPCIATLLVADLPE